MADASLLRELLTSEFVTFLGTKLQDSRDEVQKLIEINSELQKKLDRTRNDRDSQAQQAESSSQPQAYSNLVFENGTLRELLESAISQAHSYRAEADEWKKRHEELESRSVFQVPAPPPPPVVPPVKAIVVPPPPPIANPPTFAGEQRLTQFLAFVQSLPKAIIPEVLESDPFVVFQNTKKKPSIPKSAKVLCPGGPLFFGESLRWYSTLTKNAYVIVPEYNCTIKGNTTPDSPGAWSKATSWSCLSGQRRELFYQSANHVRYAGTFYVHAGLQAVKVMDLNADNNMLQYLAQESIKGSKKKGGKQKKKDSIPAVVKQYRSGAKTVQVLALQRVGFNGALLELLKDPGKCVKCASDAADTRLRSQQPAYLPACPSAPLVEESDIPAAAEITAFSSSTLAAASSTESSTLPTLVDTAQLEHIALPDTTFTVAPEAEFVPEIRPLSSGINDEPAPPSIPMQGLDTVKQQAEENWEELVLGSSPTLSQISLDGESFERLEVDRARVASERREGQAYQHDLAHIPSTSVERQASSGMPVSLPTAITPITDPPAFVGEDRFSQFCLYLRGLPSAHIPKAYKNDMHVVKNGSKMKTIPKTARGLCSNEEFVFFGPFLRWCPSLQHAYAIVPEGRFKIQENTPPDSLGVWHATTKWTQHHKQRRELFYLTNVGIRYAGTFYVFVALRTLDARSLNVDEAVILHLAETSVKGKKKKGKAKAKLCIPIIADHYRHGSKTVQVIGLQRIGYNGALLEFLKDPSLTLAQAQATAVARTASAVHQPATESHAERHDIYVPEAEPGRQQPFGSEPNIHCQRLPLATMYRVPDTLIPQTPVFVGKARFTQFLSFIQGLPDASVPKVYDNYNFIMSKGTQLGTIPKDARAACTGDLLFLGTSLRWCSYDHACAIVPEHSHDITEDGGIRELFYSSVSGIRYAGIYRVHVGPKALVSNGLYKKLAEMQHLAYTVIPTLSTGTRAVRALGLQRIGFNGVLLEHLNSHH